MISFFFLLYNFVNRYDRAPASDLISLWQQNKEDLIIKNKLNQSNFCGGDQQKFSPEVINLNRFSSPVTVRNIKFFFNYS